MSHYVYLPNGQGLDISDGPPDNVFDSCFELSLGCMEVNGDSDLGLLTRAAHCVRPVCSM